MSDCTEQARKPIEVEAMFEAGGTRPGPWDGQLGGQLPSCTLDSITDLTYCFRVKSSLRIPDELIPSTGIRQSDKNSGKFPEKFTAIFRLG